MYSLKKEILLVIGTALNTKPTWASHIPTEDPEKARPPAQPPAPAQPGSLMLLAKRKPAPLCPCGLRRPCWPLASARQVPAHAKPSL